MFVTSKVLTAFESAVKKYFAHEKFKKLSFEFASDPSQERQIDFVTEDIMSLLPPLDINITQQTAEGTSSNINLRTMTNFNNEIHHFLKPINSVLENDARNVIIQEMINSNGIDNFFARQSAADIRENGTNFVNEVFKNTSSATSNVSKSIVANATEILTENTTEYFTDVVNWTISDMEDHTVRTIPHFNRADSKIVSIIVGTLLGILVLCILIGGFIYCYNKRKLQLIERDLYTVYRRESEVSRNQSVILADSTVAVDPALVQDDYAENRHQIGIQESRL